MKVNLQPASIIGPSCTNWMQAYCQDGVAVILQIADEKTGPLLLKQIIDLLEGPLTVNLVDLEKILHKFNQATMLGALRLVDGTGLFYCRKATALLKRAEKTSILIDNSGIIAGHLQAKDRILLIGAAAAAHFGIDRLTHILSKEDNIQTVAEALLLELHRQSLDSVVGLAMQVQYLPAKQAADSRNTERMRNKVKRLQRQFIGKTLLFLKSLISLPRKVWLFGGVLLLLLALLNRFSGVSMDIKQFSDSFQLARHQYEEGKALLQLNKLRAREVLVATEKDLQSLIANLKEGQQEYRQANKLLDKVEQALTIARAAYQVKPALFFDLSLIRPGLTANKMVESGGKVYLYSASKKLLAVLVLATKASKVLAGGNWLKEASQLAVGSNQQWVLVTAGVGAIGNRKKIVLAADEEWGNIVDMDYFGGNLYLLDQQKGIWKYPILDDGLGNKRQYLKTGVSLANPVSMAIDGNIWVMDEGHIFKYVGGRRDNFVLRGLAKPFGRDALLVKTKNLNNLYILDRNNSRIVAVDEDGRYQAEYHWSGFKTVDGFGVSEHKHKIYLLQRDKIYTVQLQ